MSHGAGDTMMKVFYWMVMLVSIFTILGGAGMIITESKCSSWSSDGYRKTAHAMYYVSIVSLVFASFTLVFSVICIFRGCGLHQHGSDAIEMMDSDVDRWKNPGKTSSFDTKEALDKMDRLQSLVDKMMKNQVK